MAEENPEVPLDESGNPPANGGNDGGDGNEAPNVPETPTLTLNERLKAKLDEFTGMRSRGATYMRVRSALAKIIRAEVGPNYFVTVRATRQQRERGEIQVRARIGSDTVNLALLPA